MKPCGASTPTTRPRPDEATAASPRKLTEIGVTFPEDLGHTPGLEYGGQENQAPELPLVRRVHWSDKEKGGIWSFVWNEVQKADIDVRLKTPVERLLFDPGTREVKGVVADGKNIKARKGVVLCGGGFPTNAEMMRENISKFPILAQGSPECDGSAIRMAIDAGAACMGWGWGATAGYLNGSIEEGKGQAASAFIQLTHNSAPHSEIPYIVVDSFGKRLISELDIVNIASAILSKTANGVAYQITNDIGALDLNWGQVGEVKYETADTVEELAEKLGINPEGLRKTVESWDGYIANGEDPEFGRTNLYPFGNGPFAGVEMYPCVLDTYGGPLTDAEMRVLKAIDHEPIPRLYRGGVLGFRTYPLCGAAVGMALCTGMIAGRNVAALENWQ